MNVDTSINTDTSIVTDTSLSTDASLNTGMTWPHLITGGAACIAALAVLCSMLFGWNVFLDTIGIHRTLRDVGVALWAFLLPAWFTVEEAWFTPKDPRLLESFRKRQSNARLTWTLAAGAVSVIIGMSAPSTQPAAPASSSAAPARTGAHPN
jgi:hypothetical protein